MNNKVLVTGAAGVLGSALMRRNRDYIATDRYGRGTMRGATYRILPMDITDPVQLAGTIYLEQPKVIIHCAAMTDVDRCTLRPLEAYKVNAEGTRNIAQACAESDARLIYISTNEVEDEELMRPTGPYGHSKLLGEYAVKDLMRPENYTIVRTSWLFGRGCTNFFDWAIRRLADTSLDRMIKVAGDEIGNPTYAEDLAVFLGALADRHLRREGLRMLAPIMEVANSGGPATRREVLETIYESYRIRDLPRLAIEEVPSSYFMRPYPVPNAPFRDMENLLPPWKGSLLDYVSEWFEREGV